MLKIIEVIQDANAKNCPLPALALALTLPDICSQIEYPDEKNVGYRYRNWYNSHVHKHEEFHCTLNKHAAPVDSACHSMEEMLHKFNGYACYKLRCLLLHQGDAAMSGEIKYDNLYFHIHDGEASQPDRPADQTGRPIEHISINSKLLCDYLCLYAKKYYNEHTDKELFTKKLVHD